jgi:branched-chain amino acid aminotransferase
MKECINKKFILDGKVVDCEHFHADLINKGTSLYEVIRVIKGRFLFAEDHIKRLLNSASLARLDFWYSEDEISTMIERLPQLNNISEGNVKIVFNFLDWKKNHFLAYFVPHRYPERIDYGKGVKLITFPFTREDPNKKIWRPGFRAAVDDIIKKKNVYEVLLVDENNLITEASKANFFTILNGTVYTPPSEKVLPGITRKYVLSICTKQNIPVLEKDICVNTLEVYDAVFLTGTSPGVVPVAKVDHLIFGVKDQVLRILMREFEKLVEEQLG